MVLAGMCRYNGFILYYPMGVTGELLCAYQTYLTLEKYEVAERAFTYFLPGSDTVIFDYCKFLMYVVPITYILGFPPLFGHMVK